MHGARYFTTLDLKSGYWQVPMNEDSKYLTAFSPGPGLGHYEFNVMPFGLTNAPSTFQRLMDAVLKDLNCAIAYLDDVVIFSPNSEQHLKDIEAVLNRFENHGLKINQRKCKFFAQEIEYLGYIVSKEGIKPNTQSLDALKKWQTPDNTKKLQQFLGTCNYYSRFLKNYSKIAFPLYRLLRKGVTWLWDEDCQNSFKTLISELQNLPTLGLPDRNSSFIISCDASDVAVGAVLSQTRNGKQIPISFASQVLNTSQRRYSTTDKELYALIWSCRKFKPYLYGKKFEILTDHNPLVHVRNMKDTHGRRARWFEELEQYDYDIRYIQGKENIVADALSRSICTVLQSTIDFGLEQLKDPFIQDLIKSFKGTNFKNYALLNGILYRIGRRGHVLVVPDHLKNKIIEDCHINNLSHLGVAKTIDAIRQRFYWPKMDHDIEERLRSCESCLINKSKNYTPIAELNPVQVDEPFCFWEVDITGPLNLTERGNKYIVVFTDHFTNWIEAYPIPDQTAQTVAQIMLDNVIARFGVPVQVHSDQGTQFESTLFHHLCMWLGIKKTKTTPYHPMGNGQVERANKTIKEMLRHHVNEWKNDWDLHLGLPLLAIRSCVCKKTKFSPAKLCYGRELRLPIDIEFPLLQERRADGYHIFVKNLSQKLKSYFDIARENTKKSNFETKRYYDTKVCGDPYNIGDKVYLKSQQSNKLDKLFDGPYIIKLNKHPYYDIQDFLDGKLKRVHFNRLFVGKRYEFEHGDETPQLRRSTRIRRPPKYISNCWGRRNVAY
ncbi:Transposon Ty3-I Gag-Pol polyprotein [Thelohanellus kitauei]|nr:Transposon Ty3-I Gag-Pol polyprotein [Thelohanellus kitauei]KII70791.1 Transposon Ty3-I Gag-Pol polyprotein [Thelohanellus kitauei]